MVSGVWIIGAILSVGLGVAVYFIIFCSRRRETRGARSLAILFAGAFLWMLADGIQLLTPSNPAPTVGVELRVLGPDIIVSGLILFALEYTGRDDLIRRETLALLAVKPVLSLGILVSPLRGAQIQPTGTSSPVGYAFDPTLFAVVHSFYGWILTFVALVVLGRMLLRVDFVNQRQLVVVILAFLLPLVVNVAVVLGQFPFDLTSASFLVAASMLAVAIFRLRLMDAIPIARQKVIEEIEDMVLVLDENGDVITVNRAVRDTFGLDTAPVDLSIADLFEVDSDELLDETDRPEEIELSIDGNPRYLDVSTSNILDYRDDRVADVLVCRDVTEKRRRQQELRRREENLRLLKDLQSRFLRHNLRNRLTVIEAHAEALADEDDQEQVEQYDTIRTEAQRILDWGRKARSIEDLIEVETMVRSDLSPMVEDVVEGMRETHPDVTIEMNLTTEAWVSAVPQINLAFENLLDNAARHNTAQDPYVRVETSQETDEIIVRIIDNGPGIANIELVAFHTGQETPLDHSSGFGLWLVYWVVEKSGGDITFDTDDGTTVTMRFDAATAPEPEQV